MNLEGVFFYFCEQAHAVVKPYHASQREKFKAISHYFIPSGASGWLKFNLLMNGIHALMKLLIQKKRMSLKNLSAVLITRRYR